MPIKTSWHITFACGHTEERDLHGKRADQRAGYAAWLATKDCTVCWREAQTESGERLSDAEWKAKKRKEEAAEIGLWENKAGMLRLRAQRRPSRGLQGCDTR